MRVREYQGIPYFVEDGPPRRVWGIEDGAPQRNRMRDRAEELWRAIGTCICCRENVLWCEDCQTKLRLIREAFAAVLPVEGTTAPDRRQFPIQRQEGAKAHLLRVPWSVAEKAYSVYSAKYGTRQSLERLAERGGFCPDEMDEFHPTWRDEASEIESLKAELAALRAVPQEKE